MLDFDETVFNSVTYPKFRTEYGTAVSVRREILGSGERALRPGTG